MNKFFISLIFVSALFLSCAPIANSPRSEFQKDDKISDQSVKHLGEKPSRNDAMNSNEFEITFPKGLKLTVTNLKISNDRIINSDNPKRCGEKYSSRSLLIDYEYKINWHYSNFHENIPTYDVKIEIKEQNGDYIVSQIEPRTQKVNGYIPNSGQQLNGTLTDNIKGNGMKFSAICVTLEVGKSSDADYYKALKLLVPNAGSYNFQVFLNNKPAANEIFTVGKEHEVI